jgi:hypothetical protein
MGFSLGSQIWGHNILVQEGQIQDPRSFLSFGHIHFSPACRGLSSHFGSQERQL